MAARYDFDSRRLFLRHRLASRARIVLDPGQANYLVNVLRMAEATPLLVFNGVDGEWRATLHSESRKSHLLLIGEQTRPQPPRPDLQYLFAPLKQARLDYMVEKAVEMGVGRVRPVLTQHSQVNRVNRERMEANAIEAAEQCGILSVPLIDEPVPLLGVIDGWLTEEGGRQLIFCDESETGTDPLATLGNLDPSPLAVLVGPEGGFSAEERAFLLSQPFVTPLPLGPRILRADTAAVAALALVQAAIGDWQED